MAGAAAGLVLYVVTLVLVRRDTTFTHRWLTLALWLVSVAVVPAGLIVQRRQALLCRPRARRPAALYLLLAILVLLALAFSFALLVQYPFVAIYDQVRDGGLHAEEIVRGQLRNLFGYGRYDSYGLVISAGTSFFYRWLGASTLVYRLPAALLAVLDVLLVYRLVSTRVGRLAGWVSALILLTLPLHLFYGRTELVIMVSGVLMTGIVYAMTRWLEEPSPVRYLLLGLYLGFACTFYGSLVSATLVATALVVAVTAYRCLVARRRARLLCGLGLLVVFFLVGFGPKVLFTPPALFFHTNDALTGAGARTHDSGLSGTLQRLIDQRRTIARNYWKSLRTYVDEATHSTHYPVAEPLLPKVVAGFFLLGAVAVAVRSSSALLWTALVYAAALPLTNSALTNYIDTDNRLFPALVPAAVLAGYGVSTALDILRLGVRRLGRLSHRVQAAGIVHRVPPRWVTWQIVPALGVAALSAYLLVGGVRFFVREPANNGYSPDDYLSMHLVYYVQSHAAEREARNLCLDVSPERFQYFNQGGNLLLVSEQYEYFLPAKTVRIYTSPFVKPNEVYVAPACREGRVYRFAVHTLCRHHDKFTCPAGGDLRIGVADDNAPPTADALVFAGTSLVIPPAPAFIP